MRINLLKVTFTVLTMSLANAGYSQIVLNADNTANNTYELINSVFVKSGSSSTAVEAPDQTGVSANSVAGSHTAFGRHITEVFDATLNKNVFAFYAHVADDNDVSTTKTDRQRIEIKTFGSSPDNLKGVDGEIVQYKWRFKIPTGWQPSSNFTHIHQVKGVDGDDSDPVFTITLRKGTPNKLELIYVKDENASTDKKVILNLSLFENTWVEATETITIGANGTYSMYIKRVSDNVSLLSYSNSDIQTIRADNSFLRPKWGIYRSIASPGDLRDEVLYFSDFSIEELATLPVKITSFSTKKEDTKVVLNWQSHSESNLTKYIIQRSINGEGFIDIGQLPANNMPGSFSYLFVDDSPTFGANYYRLASVGNDDKKEFSHVTVESFGIQPTLSVYPNPTYGDVNISSLLKNDVINITDATGRLVFEKKVSQNGNHNLNMENINSGIYLISVWRNNRIVFNNKILKN